MREGLSSWRLRVSLGVLRQQPDNDRRVEAGAFGVPKEGAYIRSGPWESIVVANLRAQAILPKSAKVAMLISAAWNADLLILRNRDAVLAFVAVGPPG